MMNKKIARVFWNVTTLLLCGCHNIRRYEHGNVRLQTATWKDDQYATLSKGSLSMPYNAYPPLLIRMSDHAIINTATDEHRKIEVGNPTNGEMFAFPLRADTVVSLFGKPDRITEDFIE